MLFRKKKYTEEELIKGCLNNDRKAQEALYKRFFPKMMAMCMNHTKDREKSLEIVNDGFLKVFTKIHSFRSSGSFEGWVRRIVYFSLVDYFRGSKSNKQFVPPDDLLLVPVHESIHSQLATEDLFELVDRLPDTTRKVFLLFAIEGYKHDEIAAILDISNGTSKWHLASARKKLKEMILGLKDRRSY